jgi:TIR domain
MEICRLLEKRGVGCWIAPRDVAPSANYGEEIVKGIREALVCLLVLSDSANRSDMVANEIERAVHYQKTIVPLRIREVMPSGRLEVFVSAKQWVDAFASPISDRIDYIAAVVLAAGAGRPAPTPSPQRVGVAARTEQFLERSLRHKLLTGVGVVLMLATIGLAGLYLGRETREIVRDAATDIRSASANAERARETIEVVSNNIAAAFDPLSSPQRQMLDMAAALRTGNLASVRASLKLPNAGNLLNASLADPSIARDFIRIANNPMLERLFAEMVVVGFDPDTLVGEGAAQSTLLRTALQEGNYSAAIGLLAAGASPHLFRSLWGDTNDPNVFVLPLVALASSTFDNTQRKAIAEAMVRRGVTVPNNTMPTWISPSQMRASENANALFAGMGVKLVPQSSICSRSAADTCRGLRDPSWCNAITTFPSRFSHSTSQTVFNVKAETVGFAGVFKNRAYFVTYYDKGSDVGFGLAEATKNLDEINLYFFMDPAAGMGHCSDLVDIVNGAQRRSVRETAGGPKRCWRRHTLRRVVQPTAVFHANTLGNFEVSNCKR